MNTGIISPNRWAGFLFFVLSAFIFPRQLPAQQSIFAAVPGDFADPTIITDGKLYYAAGTSSEWAPHYPVFKSSDLQHWEQSGYIFDKSPEWALNSFWAPELFKIGDRYFVYYTARRKSDSVSCIGVASSSYPDHGYTDHGVLVDYGKEAIDAFIFDDNGQLYISFKAYGLDKRPIELLAYRLSPDGTKIEGNPFMLLRDDQRAGLEGQSLLKRGDYYYLFYSAGNCCGASCSYNVQVARAKNITGPYERYDSNPILSEYNDWKCAGHGSFIKGPAGDTVYLHHAYSKVGGIYTGRQGMLARLEWNTNTGWPLLDTDRLKSSSASLNIQDDFSRAKPAVYWQWDWRHASPQISQSGGRLRLKGVSSENNATGVVITVRPSQPAFTVSTEVERTIEGLCGITYYGDADAAVGVGMKGDKVVCWMTKESKHTTVNETTYKGKGPVELMMTISSDHRALFKYRNGQKDWTVLNEEPIKIDFLPQWDRSPRAGLHVKGDGVLGSFGYFKLVYE
jgi:beta-xylosidase